MTDYTQLAQHIIQVIKADAVLAPIFMAGTNNVDAGFILPPANMIRPVIRIDGIDGDVSRRGDTRFLVKLWMKSDCSTKSVSETLAIAMRFRDVMGHHPQVRLLRFRHRPEPSAGLDCIVWDAVGYI